MTSVMTHPATITAFAALAVACILLSGRNNQDFQIGIAWCVAAFGCASIAMVGFLSPMIGG